MCAALGGLSRGLGTGPSRRRACSPPGPGSPRRPELSCRCSCLCSAPQPRRLLSRARVSTQRMKSYLVFRSPVLCPRAAETQAPVADAGLASGPCTKKRCAPLLARGWGVFPVQGQGAKREETGANGRAREQTGGSGFSLESLEGRDFRSRARGSLRQDPSCLGPWSPVLFVCVCMCTRVCVRAGRGSWTPPAPVFSVPHASVEPVVVGRSHEREQVSPDVSGPGSARSLQARGLGSSPAPSLPHCKGFLQSAKQTFFPLSSL